MYEAEVGSGNLEWSPPHLSDNFWKSNASRLNENEYDLLRYECLKFTLKKINKNCLVSHHSHK